MSESLSSLDRQESCFSHRRWQIKGPWTKGAGIQDKMGRANENNQMHNSSSCRNWFLPGWESLHEELLCPAHVDIQQKLGCVLGMAVPQLSPAGTDQNLFSTSGSKPTSDLQESYFVCFLIIYLHVNSFYPVLFFSPLNYKNNYFF